MGRQPCPFHPPAPCFSCVAPLHSLPIEVCILQPSESWGSCNPSDTAREQHPLELSLLKLLQQSSCLSPQLTAPEAGCWRAACSAHSCLEKAPRGPREPRLSPYLTLAVCSPHLLLEPGQLAALSAEWSRWGSLFPWR